MVTSERFASGMTFDQCVRFVATPENLAREASMNRPRPDRSGFLRRAYEAAQLTEAQAQAWKCQGSPFFRIWASAGIDEMASMLHERLRVGSLA